MLRSDGRVVQAGRDRVCDSMVWPSASCSKYVRAPCSTPGEPPVMLAACRPLCTPSPPASKP
nr:hypothetical protein [Fodinicola feengrottensis]